MVIGASVLKKTVGEESCISEFICNFTARVLKVDYLNGCTTL